jgi:hypothetical protein
MLSLDVPDEMPSEVPSVTTELSVVVTIDGDKSEVVSVSVPVSVAGRKRGRTLFVPLRARGRPRKPSNPDE